MKRRPLRVSTLETITLIKPLNATINGIDLIPPLKPCLNNAYATRRRHMIRGSLSLISDFLTELGWLEITD
jgi:hypothetical protein